MPSPDLAWTPGFELAAMVRERQVSPVEIMNAVLGQIDCFNLEVNAFAFLDPERARSAARDSERELMAGRVRGPLHGVPVTIKDVTHLAGVPTGYGTRRQPRVVPTRSAPLDTETSRNGWN